MQLLLLLALLLPIALSQNQAGMDPAEPADPTFTSNAFSTSPADNPDPAKPPQPADTRMRVPPPSPTPAPATDPQFTTSPPEETKPGKPPQPNETGMRTLPPAPTPELTRMPPPSETNPPMRPVYVVPQPTTTTVPAPTTPSDSAPRCPPRLPSDATCADRLQGAYGPISEHRCNRRDLVHTCSIAGDPHVATFEGCAYHHMGAGYHIAAANRRFAAISMQKECGSSTALQRIQYACGLRPDPVTYMHPRAVSCEKESVLAVFSDAYADRLDHCDLGYQCTPGPVDFAQTNLTADVLVYDIKCSSTGCAVSQFNWATQKTVHLSASNTTESNIGSASRPVWLVKTPHGVRISMDKEFGCAGTVLEYGRYSFQATIDAGCEADRGTAVGMYPTSSSPLYGRTFGLCGHIDPQGRTGSGQRPGNEYSAGGRRRPVYYDRCRQMDYGQFYQMKQWSTIARQTMCGEQLAQVQANLYAVLAQALESPAVCTLFAPGGARVPPAADDTWTKFQALADESERDAEAVEPVVSCDTVDAFFDSLGSCNMALLDPTGMTPDELAKRHASLQMCLYDACRTKDVGVALSNTVAFRQSMTETSWQVEEIVAAAAAVAVAVVAVLVAMVVWYRRRLQKEHRQALLSFQKEVAADQNDVKGSIQFAI